MTRTVAIVGGGLSGTLTAVHLMRRACADDLHVVLFNRSGPSARGLAYGTRSDTHVLNVPAGRMSAFAADPGHFVRYAQRHDASVHGESFVRRSLYGDYLDALLRTTQAEMAEPQRFRPVAADVSALSVDERSVRLRLSDGRAHRAERVVLALGNFAPADPEVPGMAALADDARYVRDPWAPRALDAVDSQRPVLLLGTGLTMADVALSLGAHGASAMHALSRRGLLPQAHLEHAGPPLALALPLELQRGPAALGDWLALVRARCDEQARRGIDWRETLASLRQATPQLWQRLDARQRRQFLRHLQPYWDAHRHRLAPQAAQGLKAAIESRALTVHAGRILDVEDRGEGLRLRYRARADRSECHLEVGALVNCTGPNTRLGALREPMLRSLLAAGVISADPLGLGIAVDDDLAVLGRDGRASPVLHYIGPFLRARYWECTAAPELRAHAERLAVHLCASTRRADRAAA